MSSPRPNDLTPHPLQYLASERGDRQHLRNLVRADGAVDLSNECQRSLPYPLRHAPLRPGHPRSRLSRKKPTKPTPSTSARAATSARKSSSAFAAAVTVHRTFGGFRLTAPARHALPTPLTSDGRARRRDSPAPQPSPCQTTTFLQRLGLHPARRESPRPQTSLSPSEARDCSNRGHLILNSAIFRSATSDDPHRYRHVSIVIICTG